MLVFVCNYSEVRLLHCQVLDIRHN